MKNYIILLIFLINSVGLCFYLGRRGVKGLREEKMVADQQRNEVTGKDAIAVAKIYIFFSGLCLVLTIFFLILLIKLIIFAWSK